MPKPLIQTTGRREEAVARVRLRAGTGQVVVNGKPIEQYFTALREAGFQSMPRLLELGVTEQLLAMDPAFFGSLQDIPLHMAMEVIR